MRPVRASCWSSMTPITSCVAFRSAQSAAARPAMGCRTSATPRSTSSFPVNLRLGGRLGHAFLASRLPSAQRHVVEEHRGDQRQDQDCGTDQEDLMKGGRQPDANRMQHLVEEGRTLRSEAARLGPARRDLRRIEEGLWTAAGTGEEASGLSRKVKAGHFVADVDGQLLAEHGAQHRGAERSTNLAPELDLA